MFPKPRGEFPGAVPCEARIEAQTLDPGRPLSHRFSSPSQRRPHHRLASPQPHRHPAPRLHSPTMQNEEGDNVDLYIPRKCSSTNRLITSKDVSSVQLNVGHVDENGVYTGQFTTFALCGFVRAQGDADSALDRLWAKKKAELGQ